MREEKIKEEKLKEEFLKKQKELELSLQQAFGEEGYRLLLELLESGALRHLLVPGSFASEWGVYVLEEGVKKLRDFVHEKTG